MTKSNVFLTTLLAAASAMAIVPCSNARADGVELATVGQVIEGASGTGTQDDPYSGYVTMFPFTGFTSDDTVYISGLGGYMLGGPDYSLITIDCNIVIGPDGWNLTNGHTLTEYRFTGDISGTGDWTGSAPGNVSFRYIFTGDLSGYSGNMAVTSTYDINNFTYLNFGDGGAAATTTNVSGTGEVASCYYLRYNYSPSEETADTRTTLTVGNTLVRAKEVEFTGDVDYAVSSDLSGYDPTAKTDTLKITNTGTTTVTGTIYGFGNISVSADSTLVVGGAVVLADAISNSGSIVLMKGESEYSTVNKAVFDLASIYSSDVSSYTLISQEEGASLVVDENGSWSDLGVTNFAYYGAPERLVNLVIGDTGTISVESMRKITVTWNGPSGDVWNAKNVNWLSPIYGADCRFLSADNVIFGAAGNPTDSASIVNFDSGDSILVGDMTVAGGNFALDNSTGATITGDTLIVDAGAVLRVGTSASDNITLSFGDTKLGGTLIYNNAANSWTSLEFTADGANLCIYDAPGLSIGTATVSADATISSHITTTGSGDNSAQLSIGALAGAGNLAVVGSDAAEGGQTFRVEVSSMADYTGTLSVKAGSAGEAYLMLVGGDNKGNYSANAAATIEVGAGGTLDVNGKHETTFGVTLAGGTLTSSADIGRTVIQLPTIAVTADSTVNAESGISFGMLAREYGESDLYLGGNTLTKTGAGTFFLVDTSIYNSADKDPTTEAGAIVVNEGTLMLDGADTSLATITVASGATLDISKAGDKGDSTVGKLTSNGTLTIESGDSLAIVGDSEISGALLISGALSVGNGATVDLTGVTTSQASGVLSVSGENSTLKIANYEQGTDSNFGANMFNGALQISNGGTLEITEAQAAGAAGNRGFAVTSGKGTYKYSGNGTSYISQPEDSASRNIHLGDDATLVFDVENAAATLAVEMTIAKGMSDSSDVANAISTGALIKAGAGTLEMSGDNLYSGGTTVAEGTLVVKNGNALGSGNVSVEAGATMQIDTTLVVSTDASKVSFAAGSMLALSEELFASAATATYASDAEQISVAVVTAYSVEFGETDLSAADDNDVTDLVNASGVIIDSGIYQLLEWTYRDDTLYVLAQIPEPSMFGLLAGFGALGFVATRRRRRKA